MTMLRRAGVALLAALVLGGALPGAQAPGKPVPAPDPSTQILEELKAMRQLLENILAAVQPAARPAPLVDDAPVTIKTVPTDHVLGKADAPVTIVEFTDLQCPFCRQFRTATFEQIKRDYIDTGKVRFISRDLPLTAIHPLAMAAARMSICAGEQGRFWEMRHALLVNGERLSTALFVTLAADLSLNPVTFAACTNQTERLDARINADIAEARAVQIDGTPAFVIGRTVASGLTGVRVIGAQPFEQFETAITRALAGR